MSTTNKIKFYRGNSAPANPQEGYIWFNSSNGILAIYKDGNWEYYSGLVDATYADKKLTITKKNGTDKVEVDLGDLINSEVISQLNKLDATVWSTGGTTAPDFKTDANKNKRVAVKVVQTDGKITGVEVLENDIASSLDISDINDRIDVIVGNDVNKSIRSIATDVLTEVLVDENAADAYDSLAEMSAWLQSHPESAAAMELQIKNNKEDIAEIKEDVGEISTAIETINTTIEENELVTASALTNLDERVIALEGSAVTSVTGESYITAETTDGAVTVKATIGTVVNGDQAIALASDVKSYVDSQWEWVMF